MSGGDAAKDDDDREQLPDLHNSPARFIAFLSRSGRMFRWMKTMRPTATLASKGKILGETARLSASRPMATLMQRFRTFQQRIGMSGPRLKQARDASGNLTEALMPELPPRIVHVMVYAGYSFMIYDLGSEMYNERIVGNAPWDETALLFSKRLSFHAFASFLIPPYLVQSASRLGEWVIERELRLIPASMKRFIPIGFALSTVPLMPLVIDPVTTAGVDAVFEKIFPNCTHRMELRHIAEGREG